MVKHVLASKANSSVKRYVAQYRYFAVYLKSRGVKLVLPCVSLLVSEYLSYLHDTKRSYAVVLSAFYALKWVHDFIRYGAQGNPIDTALNHNLVQASKRVFSGPVNKEPITLDMIYRICVRFAHESSNLRDLRTALLFVLGFYGLLRINEILDVEASDILVHDDHLEINIKEVKLINLGKVIKYLLLIVAVFNVLSHYCPDICQHLFRTLQPHRENNSYTLSTSRLSYTRCRELENFSYRDNSVSYSTHSLRSGGATFIADDLAKLGSSDRLLMLHGRCKSETAKNIYIKDSLDSRLQLTRLFLTSDVGETKYFGLYGV